jgi:hypothetical protein
MQKRWVESTVLLQNQCRNSSVMTTSVALGSCTSRPDWLSSLQVAKFTTTPESPAASTGSTMLSPWLSRKNVC